MSEVGFVLEIRIDQFWRKHLGDHEYMRCNPDDLRRWYTAMEQRGPLEIRDYLNERASRYPRAQVTGIVATAPHPPREIVQVWLESHDKVHTGPYWAAGAALLVLVWLCATNLASFDRLKPINKLQMHPPQIGALPPNGAPTSPGAPLPNATLPQTLPLPANTAGQRSQSGH